MGIVIVLILYLAVLAVLASISGAILWAATKWYLRRVPSPKRRPIALAAAFPFVCVLYVGTWFVVYAVTNSVVFHRDPMLGDGWSTPIGNGYAIDMIDVTDHGFLHSGGDLNGPGSIADVRRLQIANDQIYGTADSKVMQNFATGLQGEDEFFHLDTRTHSKDNFTSEAQLAVYARKQGLQLRLKPIAEVYNSFRFTWFDWFALALLFGLPSLSFARLLFHLRAYKQAHLSTSDN